MVAGLCFVAVTTAALSCPSEAAVGQALLRLRPATSAPAGEVFQLIEQPDGVEVSLRSDERPVAMRRRLPRATTCEEQALVVATVIAAWEAELGPVRLSLPAHSLTLALPAAPRRPRLEYGVAAAFVASLAGTSFAPGALVDVRVGARAWAATLGLLGAGPRTAPLGTGSATWTRAALRLGAQRRVSWSRYGFDFDAGALLALLYMEGTGFAETHRELAFDPGLMTGVRFGVQLGRWRPLLAVEVDGWPVRQLMSASLAGATVSTEVPRIEALFQVGVEVGARVAP